MTKHDLRELVARARKRHRHSAAAMPLVDELQQRGFAQRRFDPAREAARLHVPPTDTGQLVTALSKEARATLRAVPQVSTPPYLRYRYPGGYSAAPPEAETFILTTPTELDNGEGCTGPLDANTVGLEGQRIYVDSGVATAAPPNGDEATAWFVTDAPGEGIFIVSAQVVVTGNVMITESLSFPGHVRFKLQVKCSASQTDHGSSYVTSLDYLTPPLAMPYTMSGSTGSSFFWSAQSFTTPPFIIGVDRSGGSVPPVVIGAGVVIGMEAFGPGFAVTWDFCPGIVVPLVTAEFQPAQPVG